ncbi:hypothetical protein N431DRAFT_559216 [Stipitochalara longipes BDJ]|nr:hypothetical protein N431DRAFT_559216 [Stipitochalara longipes BDJ]
MVQFDHRGRFATGCSNCRQRKIKCDEARPSCKRCLKGRWVCPGYKTLTDLTFRDQNEIIAGKAHRQQNEQAQIYSVGTSRYQTHAPSHILVPKSPNSSISLNLGLEMVARSYFLSNHVIVGSEAVARGQYEFLSDFLARQQEVDPALHHSLNAAAFAAFGNSHELTKMLQKSRLECNLAIQAVNAAIQSPETAVKDSTVIAAMLLWTFEALTFVNQPDGKKCIDQLTGGLALLTLRGPRQLDTRLGFQIFLQAYFLVVTTCIQKEHALPPSSFTLRSYVQPYLDAGDCTWRILDLMARFANLLDAAEEQNHLDSDGLQHLLSSAAELDQDFQDVISSLPSDWQYQTFNCSNPVSVYNKIYHTYSDPWTMRYWNYIRLCRIHLQQVILHNSFHSPNPSSIQYQTINATITQLSTDICATVPQHAHYLQRLQPQQIRSESSSDHIGPPQVVPHTAGIYHLLWPLFAIGKMKTTPLHQRKWIINRMEYLGRISGISQAFAGSEILKADETLIL